MRRVTEWILEQLAERRIRATFFIVGQIAVSDPELVRSVHEAGHEVASHGWDHRRVLAMTPAAFREDVRKSKEALEQACGAVVRRISGADLQHHAPDRLGPGHPGGTGIALRFVDLSGPTRSLWRAGCAARPVPRAGRPARDPGVAAGHSPSRWGERPCRWGWLFPTPAIVADEAALRLSRRDPRCVATVLYFHPWEFDPEQPRLPLGPLDRFRTYVGIRQSRRRLLGLLVGHRFLRGVDLARELDRRRERLPSIRPSDGPRRANLIAEHLPQACLGK